MNIAIISHSAGGGGAERVAVNLANHLLNENEVFFCAVHSDRREYYLDPKVQYDYIGTERGGFRGQLSIAINLRKYIKKNNIEVMISFISVEGIFLIGNKKLFKIYSLRNDPTKFFNSGLKKILRNLVYWDADKIVFQTPDARDYFCQKIREHGVLIPNPVKSGLPYWNEENHRKEVVVACRINKQKNLFMLLDAYRIVWEKRQDYKLSIYGEGELKEALVRYAEQLGIPLMIANALNDKPLPVYGEGLNVRDWLYVEDHCKAIDLIIHKGRVGEVYNIGGHNEMKNIDIVKIICKALDKPESLITYVTDRKGHDMRYAIDPTKIHNELGWLPETMFKDGIQKTIQWYLDNKEWWETIISGEYQNYYEKMYKNR